MDAPESTLPSACLYMTFGGCMTDVWLDQVVGTPELRTWGATRRSWEITRHVRCAAETFSGQRGRARRRLTRCVLHLNKVWTRGWTHMNETVFAYIVHERDRICKHRS
jgi:hypothetical protein